MPILKLEQLEEQLVTPKHSAALGRLITGEQVELGILRYRAGTGARPHAHPQEQIFVVLKGRMRIRIGGEVAEIGPGEAALMPPNVEHSVDALEDSEVVSCKSVIGGVGHKI